MFKEERDESRFDWTMIGDIAKGRPNLGGEVNVAVYRLMQFTLRDVMIEKYGVEAADRLFYAAGELAGREFYKALVPKTDDFRSFLEKVQKLLQDLNIGILRVEQDDLAQLKFTMTVAEDLDCSGLAVCDETICTYDEGFLAGLLGEHTGVKFRAREVDCWCSGARVCRFEIEPVRP